MRRTLGTAAAVAVASLAVTVAGTGAGGAESAADISKVGWWTRNPAAQAPADGFNVGRAPDGASSQAALEVVGRDRLRTATLILKEAGGVRQDAAVLQVCPTPNVWKKGGAQPWAESPKPECERASADLTRNATAGTWAGDVRSLLADIEDGPVSLMIVPKASAVPIGFEIQFQAPELQAEAEPSSGSDRFGFGGGSGSSSGSFTPGSTSGGGSSPSGSFTPSFDPSPPLAPALDDVAPTTEPAPEVTGDARSDSEQGFVPFPRAAAADGTGESGNKLLQSIFFVAVSAVTAVAAGFGRRLLRQREPGPAA